MSTVPKLLTLQPLKLFTLRFRLHFTCTSDEGESTQARLIAFKRNRATIATTSILSKRS